MIIKALKICGIFLLSQLVIIGIALLLAYYTYWDKVGIYELEGSPRWSKWYPDFVIGWELWINAIAVIIGAIFLIRLLIIKTFNINNNETWW